MYKYLLLFVLFSPLVGIMLMEQGAYSITLGRTGYENGASLAYGIYAFVTLAFAYLTIKTGLGRIPAVLAIDGPEPEAEMRNNQVAFILTLGVNVIFLIFLLFGAGGINVLLGQVSKGEFRTSLGGLGGISYLITKSLTPAMLAYLAVLYRNGERRPSERMLLLANLGVGGLIGLCWGFKTAALWVVLPCLLVLMWQISVRRFTWFVLVSSASIVAAAYLFDRTDESFTIVLALLLMRLTVLQGDVSWGIWDSYKAGENFPDYLPTLLPVIGDQLFALTTGISKDNYAVWVDHHFDLLLTKLAGYTLDEVAAGQSITGTPFAEGVIALGAPLYLIFALIAGVFSGLNYNVIASSIERRRPIIAAVSSTYFCFFLWPWLNGGGVVLLFHISVWAGIIINILLLFGLEWLCRTVVSSTGLVPSESQ